MTSQNGKRWKFHHVCDFLPAPLVSGLGSHCTPPVSFCHRDLGGSVPSCSKSDDLLLEREASNLTARNFTTDWHEEPTKPKTAEPLGFPHRTDVAAWLSKAQARLSALDRLIWGPRPVGNYSPQIPPSGSLGKHFPLYANKLCSPDPAAWGRKKQFSTQRKQIVFPTCGWMQQMVVGVFCFNKK